MRRAPLRGDGGLSDGGLSAATARFLELAWE
jgi:hypothetical protein